MKSKKYQNPKPYKYSLSNAGSKPPCSKPRPAKPCPAPCPAKPLLKEPSRPPSRPSSRPPSRPLYHKCHKPEKLFAPNYTQQKIKELAAKEAAKVLPALLAAGLQGKSVNFPDKTVRLSLPGKNGGRYPVNVRLSFK